MKRILHSGFTLIELLVVIAIIGTLSSIVLSQLNVARGKGNDAAIKEDLRNMLTAVELERLVNLPSSTEYGLACSSTPAVISAGTHFRNAVLKSDGQNLAGVCAVNFEPVGPPYTFGVGTKYTVNALGALIRGTYSPGGPSTSYWAASVRLSTGEYFCVDGNQQATTTPSLSIGQGDFKC